jgi:hypothetical protein
MESSLLSILAVEKCSNNPLFDLIHEKTCKTCRAQQTEFWSNGPV